MQGKLITTFEVKTKGSNAWTNQAPEHCDQACDQAERQLPGICFCQPTYVPPMEVPNMSSDYGYGI
ncbi:unnamed protein product [Camellia sinensis]